MGSGGQTEKVPVLKINKLPISIDIVIIVHFNTEMTLKQIRTDFDWRNLFGFVTFGDPDGRAKSRAKRGGKRLRENVKGGFTDSLQGFHTEPGNQKAPITIEDYGGFPVSQLQTKSSRNFPAVFKSFPSLPYSQHLLFYISRLTNSREKDNSPACKS